MLCPICGKELPDKARKCDKCGCRPKYLYGRPKPPKWLGWVAVALVVGLVIGIFLPVGSSDTAPVEEKQERLPFRNMSLLRNCYRGTQSMSLTFHAAGLKSFRILYPFSSTSRPANTPSLYFFYDEQGRFIGFEENLSEGSVIVTQAASVSYWEEKRQVEVTIHRTSVGEENLLFQYDEAGEKITEVLYSNQSETIRHVFEYNDSGKISSCTRIFTNALSLTQTYTYHYDSDGEMLSYEQWTDNVDETYQYNCITDDEGLVTTITQVTESDAGVFNTNIASYYYEEQMIPTQSVAQINLQLCLLDVLGYLSYPVLVQTDGLSSIF